MANDGLKAHSSSVAFNDKPEQSTPKVAHEGIHNTDDILPPGHVGIAQLSDVANIEKNAHPYATIRLEGKEFHALTQQAFTAEDIGKHVACINVYGSDTMMIIGFILPSQLSQLSQQQNNGLLGTMLDSYKAPEKELAEGDIDVFENTHLIDIAAVNTHKDNTLHITSTLAPEQGNNAAKIQSGETSEELIFSAEKSITLKCGESSIRLHADGRIAIRGKDLNSSAKRLNRISGGSIKIN